MNKEKKVRILSLKVKIGDIEATVTMEQARELFESLSEIFGVKEKIIPQPYPVPYPDPYPIYRRWWIEYTDTTTRPNTTSNWQASESGNTVQAKFETNNLSLVANCEYVE